MWSVTWVGKGKPVGVKSATWVPCIVCVPLTPANRPVPPVNSRVPVIANSPTGFGRTTTVPTPE
jgi:hypothetical protein